MVSYSPLIVMFIRPLLLNSTDVLFADRKSRTDRRQITQVTILLYINSVNLPLVNHNLGLYICESVFVTVEALGFDWLSC